MSDFREFNFSGTPYKGIPGNGAKCKIDLDKVAIYNECLPMDGFQYARTHIHLIGEKEHAIIIDMNFAEFDKIMEEKKNKK